MLEEAERRYHEVRFETCRRVKMLHLRPGFRGAGAFSAPSDLLAGFGGRRECMGKAEWKGLGMERER